MSRCCVLTAALTAVSCFAWRGCVFVCTPMFCFFLADILSANEFSDISCIGLMASDWGYRLPVSSSFRTLCSLATAVLTSWQALRSKLARICLWLTLSLQSVMCQFTAHSQQTLGLHYMAQWRNTWRMPQRACVSICRLWTQHFSSKWRWIHFFCLSWTSKWLFSRQLLLWLQDKSFEIH